jgi:hypothetical protein
MCGVAVVGIVVGGADKLSRWLAEPSEEEKDKEAEKRAKRWGRLAGIEAAAKDAAMAENRSPLNGARVAA